MSRYIIPRFKVVIGWDKPLQTFFGQVIDLVLEEEGEDKELVFEIGNRLLRLQLIQENSEEPTPFQREIVDF
jgi:hypothetical protein